MLQPCPDREQRGLFSNMNLDLGPDEMVTSKPTNRHSRINQGVLVLSFRKALMNALLKTSGMSLGGPLSSGDWGVGWGEICSQDVWYERRNIFKNLKEGNGWP